MSYWKHLNKTYKDSAKSKPGPGAVLDALIAAGIPAEEAKRIVEAIGNQYVTKAQVSALVGKESEVQAPNTAKDRAAKEKADKEKKREDDAGGAPVSVYVDGRAVFANNVLVGGDLAVNNLRVFNNAEIDRRIDARKAVFRELEVPRGVRIGPNQCDIDAPLVCNGPIVARQGGRFAGNNTFDGQVNLAGQVIWQNRVCTPATVVLTKSLAADGTDKLTVGSQEVTVLNDHGDQPPEQLQWAWTAQSEFVVNSVTLDGISVVTGITVDENCCVTATGTTVYVVGSVGFANVAGLTGSIVITGVT